MRVCIVNDQFSTSRPGGMYRIQGIGETLSRLGHEIVYVCPFFAVEGHAPFPESGLPTGLVDSFYSNSVGLLRRLRSIEADLFLI